MNQPETSSSDDDERDAGIVVGELTIEASAVVGRGTATDDRIYEGESPK